MCKKFTRPGVNLNTFLLLFYYSFLEEERKRREEILKDSYAAVGFSYSEDERESSTHLNSQGEYTPN